MRCRELWVLVGATALLALMAALMWEAAREESATIDEPIYVACGYMHWRAPGYAFNPEHPPLARWSYGLALQSLDLRLAPALREIWEREAARPEAFPWRGKPRAGPELFPQGPRDWYFWPYLEAQIFANTLVYGSGHDAEQILGRARAVAIGWTLLGGLVVLAWARAVAGWGAGLLALALWGVNPVVLGYGHLALLDMPVTFWMLLAVWSFDRYVAGPTWRGAARTGALVGAALATKFSGLLLGPMFLVVAAVRWRDCGRAFWRGIPVMGLAAWLVVLVVYAPFWAPAPVLPAEQAQAVGVPVWFQVLRPVLVPADFFKGVAIQAAHASQGHDAYLLGQWRTQGWWWYFPVALAVKTPIPLLLAFGLGLVGRCRQRAWAGGTPWWAAGVYLVLACVGSINIGVRYLLPVMSLLCVATAVAVGRAGRATWWTTWGLVVLAGLLVVRARPFYLEYHNEWAGGTARGYRVLADSNYDWGQDVKRLQRYLAGRKREPVYLCYFGVPQAIEYYRIGARRVTAAEAAELTEGTLIVSVNEWLRPEWAWLRQRQRPVDRVGQTLFVFELGGATP